jgi:manganese efflux pump family protein
VLSLHVLDIFAVAVGLGMDAMSVCMGVGVRWHGPRQKFRMAWHMGLFQFLMPVAGWAAGQELAALLKNVGAYIAAALVFAVGAKMLYEAVKSHPGAAAESAEHAAQKELHLQAKDPTRGWSLVVLSVATSLDALVVGFSLGLREMQIWTTSLVIGLVAGAMALIGIAIGKKAGQKFGKVAEIVGAVVLMLLGISFLALGR